MEEAFQQKERATPLFFIELAVALFPSKLVLYEKLG
jgi:hypothetical protein